MPVLLRPPAHQLDTGPTTLVDFGIGLATDAAFNGEFRAWAESRRPWRERIADAREWLGRYENDLVLLCDDPSFWAGPPSEETGFFSGRAADVTRLLVEQAHCRRIVAGRIPDTLAADGVVDLTPDAPDREWLLQSDAWGAIADAAMSLEETGVPLEQLTALELRLAVALAALRGPLVAANAIRETRRSIAGRLWAVVSEDASLTRLKRTWLRLSFVRRPFEGVLLDALKLDDLTRRDYAVVRHSLVFGSEGHYRIHEIVRSQARTWLREQPRDSRRQVERNASALLANHYLARFEATSVAGEARAVSDSMEAFYFVTLTGDSGLRERVTPYFTEQLDALGWSLSYVHRRYDDATEAFREAIKWDDADDYAHHYVAFNLDRQGKAPAEVERHYSRALELNPDNSWWHARLVAFLVCRGRISDARSRWDEAQVVLGVAERHSDRFLFETLHLWVADALLDRAELAFAREVLDEVPEWARRADVLPAYPRLRRRLAALTQAGGIGALVPANRLTSRWWEEGPELLQERLGEDADSRRVEWLAGRVEGVDQEGVHLRVAQIESHQTQAPTVGRLSVDLETFRRLCRDDERALDLEPGRHVEIGVYASRVRPQLGTTTVIRIHRKRIADWAEEPVFDSARYLRHMISTS